MFVKSIIVLFLLYFSNINGSGRDGWPGYEHYPELSGWLKLHPEPTNWKNATSNCHSEDAELASPWTGAFVSAIVMLASKREQSLSALYSGLHATLPFVNGEPPLSLELSDLERCGVVFANGTTGEVSCKERLPYICYAPAPAAPPLGCSGTDGRPGYKFQARLHGCLKLHQQPTDWLAARVSCHLEGAFLASPWNTEFSSALYELQSSDSQLASEDTISALYSGVHKTFAEGAYTFVKGEPAISLEPIELARLERCGVFFANGTMGEVSCKERLPYVCYAPATAQTLAPTPELIPTPTPTRRPAPTSTPTPAPTSTPTPAPTPTPTSAPTSTPTSTPTPAPSSTPTPAPTSTPTPAPTSTPTPEPTTTLTSAPTSTPTPAPTSTPTPALTSTPPPAPTSTPTPDLTVALTSAPTADLLPSCEEKSLGYEYAEPTGHCYKFHTLARNWNLANITCAAEGARLAVPNSDEEATIFMELLLENLKTNTIRGADFKGAVALGIYWEGVWRTVNGELLEDAGYAKWWVGWPRGEESAPYGFMETTGRLENYSAVIKVPFICEKAAAPSG